MLLAIDARNASTVSALVACLSPSAVAAPVSGTTVFACTLRNGKLVSVTARGDRLTYRYGTRRRSELTIEGGPRTGNVRYLWQRYSGPVPQLRFSRGRYSYIVFEHAGNAVAQSRAFSGLVVMRGRKRIGDHPCARHAEFDYSYPYHELPEDDVAYSAM